MAVSDLGGNDHVFLPPLTLLRKPIDPYSRLRVPKYQKVFEAVFFITFLALYYAVLLERHPEHLGPFEVLLYIWIAAFAYEEFGDFRDAGVLFYGADFWTLWDLGIILVGVAFMITSESFRASIYTLPCLDSARSTSSRRWHSCCGLVEQSGKCSNLRRLHET